MLNNHATDRTSKAQNTQRLIQRELFMKSLVGYVAKNESIVDTFLNATKPFLDFVFAEHSSMFLFQRTYSMSDMF